MWKEKKWHLEYEAIKGKLNVQLILKDIEISEMYNCYIYMREYTLAYKKYHSCEIKSTMTIYFTVIFKLNTRHE